MELLVGNRNYSSWSMRAGVLMRWLNIEYHERRLSLSFDIDSKFKTEIAKYTDMGTVPILITTGDNLPNQEPVVLGDSLSIMEYLAETYPEKISGLRIRIFELLLEI